MVVLNLAGVVRPSELRDVGFERVFRVRCERVRRDDVVDRSLRIRATLESIRKSVPIRRHSPLEPLLFARCGRGEGSFERFRGGRRHKSLYGTELAKAIEILTMSRDAEPEHRSERRTVRTTPRSQRRTRVDVEGPVDTGCKVVGHRRSVVGGQTAGRSGRKCPAKRTRFLPR